MVLKAEIKLLLKHIGDRPIHFVTQLLIDYRFRTLRCIAPRILNFTCRGIDMH